MTASSPKQTCLRLKRRPLIARLPQAFGVRFSPTTGRGPSNPVRPDPFLIFPFTDDVPVSYPTSLRIQKNAIMFQSVAILALVSAFFYCVAMVAMKSWAELPSVGLTLIIGAALLTAGAFEVFALRQERLGLI